LSFAGLHESIVGVKGDRAVLDAVRSVWASLWSDAALLYRRELSLDPHRSRMAVLVEAARRRAIGDDGFDLRIGGGCSQQDFTTQRRSQPADRFHFITRPQEADRGVDIARALPAQAIGAAFAAAVPAQIEGQHAIAAACQQICQMDATRRPAASTWGGRRRLTSSARKSFNPRGGLDLTKKLRGRDPES